jgi:hypothetical protein
MAGIAAACAVLLAVAIADTVATAGPDLRGGRQAR